VLHEAPRVLVLDDDLPICELLELALADEGWDVRASTRCHDALELLQRWPVDVILLDVRMPDMAAEVFLSTWREQTTREIPVLLLSATSDLDHHATRLGAHGILAKPFDIDELCTIMRRLIGQDEADGAAE
jgi:two-component system OmpR family response regulator